MTELFRYIVGKKYTNLEKALNEGANVNIVDKESGYTPLLLAIDNGDLKAVKQILKAGPDINKLLAITAGTAARSKFILKVTPLLFALDRLNSDNIRKMNNIVKALLAAGADPNIVSVSIMNPMLKNILSVEEQRWLQHPPARIPLISAIYSRSKSTVKILLDAGANTEQTIRIPATMREVLASTKASRGKDVTALYFAPSVPHSSSNGKEITLLLLEAGANQEYKINNKTTLQLHEEAVDENKPRDWNEMNSQEQKEYLKNTPYALHSAAIKLFNNRKKNKTVKKQNSPSSKKNKTQKNSK